MLCEFLGAPFPLLAIHGMGQEFEPCVLTPSKIGPNPALGAQTLKNSALFKNPKTHLAPKTFTLDFFKNPL